MSSVERLCSRHVLKYNLEILFLYTSARTHRGELIPASPSRYPKRNGFGSAEPNGSPFIPFWADWACWWPRLCLFKGHFFPLQIPGETVLLHASFQHIVLCFLRGCRSANLFSPPPPPPRINLQLHPGGLQPKRGATVSESKTNRAGAKCGFQKENLKP